MTKDEPYGLPAFEADLLRFGPDFARWPDPARGRGTAFSAANREARALLEEMQAVSALIKRAGRVPEAPSAVTGRILRGVAGRREAGGLPRFLRPWAIAAWGSLAAASGAAIGLYVTLAQFADTDALLAAALGGGLT